MTERKLTPVVLSGGAGARLWPLSRGHRPKQFLPIEGGKSLFEQTLERVGDFEFFLEPLVVANEKHRFLVSESCLKILGKLPTILLEPIGRNTMAAAVLAALELDPDDLMVILPSDHLIKDTTAFRDALVRGRTAAERGAIVTFGLTPTEPKTGYGYIQKGEGFGENGVFCVKSMTEKPDEQTAQYYLESGDFFWNAGIFLSRVDCFLECTANYASDILEATRSARATKHHDLSYEKFSKEAFKAIRSESIDYAILEKAENLSVVPVSMGWSDLGSFDMLAELTQPDQHGNKVAGEKSNIIIEDSHNLYINSTSRMIATLGVRDLTIIDTDDALLIADKNRDQDVKKVAQTLRVKNRDELEFHTTIHRPWGTFKTISADIGFQVKRIEVYPGKRLSLQKHNHRAEHWVVVSGLAKVTCDENQFLLKENESTFIPLGAIHRLENPGEQVLVVIEVQSGAYLGEDDIIRIEDDYKRQSDDT